MDTSDGTPVGLVLVGGASTRMGRDKATLDFDGRKLAAIAVDALHDAGISHVATIGRFSIDGAHSCPDRWPGQGPLGGIASGLLWLQSNSPGERSPASAIVLACDLPLIDADAIRSLCRAAAHPDAGLDGVLGFDGDRPQPLFSLLRSSSFDVIVQSFKNGDRSPMQVFATLQLSVAAAVADGRLVDVDTPEELAEAERVHLGLPENPPFSG